MSSVTDSRRVLPDLSTSGNVTPTESPAPASLPRSPAVGRTVQRIRTAETVRRNLQLEAERLQALGTVLQQD